MNERVLLFNATPLGFEFSGRIAEKRHLQNSLQLYGRAKEGVFELSVGFCYSLVLRSLTELLLPHLWVPEAASVQGAGREGESVAPGSRAHHGASPATRELGVLPQSLTTALQHGYSLLICLQNHLIHPL